MANGTPNFFANLMNGGGGSSTGTGGAGSHNGSVGSINGSHGNGGAIQVQDMEPPGNATYRYGDTEADAESGGAPPQSQRRQQHPLARAGSELDLPKG